MEINIPDCNKVYPIDGVNQICFLKNVIKKRFSDEVIDSLLRIKWWEWNFKKIAKNLNYIFNSDIAKLEGISI